MKLKLTIFLSALMLLFFSAGFQAKASHIVGADLSYKFTGNNSYLVSLHIYSDASALISAPTANILLNAPGCNTSRSVVLINQNSRLLDNYCAGLPITDPARLGNFKDDLYEGTITFSATEQTCHDWRISYADVALANTNNLVSNQNFYLEAYLNLTPGINNNAAHFIPLNSNTPFVVAGQEVTLNDNGIDQDRDSLAFSLVAPLSAPNTPVIYDTYTSGTSVIINPQDSTQFAFLSYSGALSPNFPIPSFSINWAGPNPHYGQPFFRCDSTTGAIRFQPIVYYNTPTVNGDNRYLVGTKIEEYRKINGIMVKVGSVTRSVIYTVVASGNKLPKLMAIKPNNPTQPLTNIVAIPGQTLTFDVVASDPNPSDLLSMLASVPEALTGAGFSISTVNGQPVGHFSWTPTAAQASKNYFFNVGVKDNACPYPGFQTLPFKIKVMQVGAVSGLPETGIVSVFKAFPNPFSQHVTFSFNNAKPIAGQEITISNVLGQEVDRIFIQAEGLREQNIAWQNAVKFPSGTYIAKLISAGKTVQTIKFIKLQ